MRDYTFSNGTFIPAGTIVSTATYPIHHDESRSYERANEFVPFRFVQGSEMTEQGSVRNQMVATGPNYLLFGFGKHAW